MSVVEMDVIEKLDEEDKEKIAYFASLLMRQTKYRHLKKEIEERREEIRKGETLTHSEIWDNLNV